MAMPDPTSDLTPRSRELFGLLLDTWELLVDGNGVPGSVGEHLSAAVAAGRKLLAEDPGSAVVGAPGEVEPATPPGAGSTSTPRPKPPARTRRTTTT